MFVKYNKMLDAGLYIVATPIGNLGDITQRAKEVLEEADVIAAEDTRNSKKLFTLLGISARKPFIAYEDHLEQGRFEVIIKLIEDGKSVALISDAGSPLISDPGYKLVFECRKRRIKVTVLPGACAVVCALQLSGLPTNRFMFAGFIPNKDKARSDLFAELKDINSTLVLYETALRLNKSLDALEKAMPRRNIAIVREISKVYEECISGSIAEVRHRLSENPIKGELVLVIAPPDDEETSVLDLEQILAGELKNSTLKDAVRKVADKYNLKKSDVYEKALELKNNT